MQRLSQVYSDDKLCIPADNGQVSCKQFEASVATLLLRYGMPTETVTRMSTAHRKIPILRWKLGQLFLRDDNYRIISFHFLSSQ